VFLAVNAGVGSAAPAMAQARQTCLFRLFYQVKNRRRSAGGAPAEAGHRGLGARISPATALPDRQSATCSACSNRRKTGRRKRHLPVTATAETSPRRGPPLAACAILPRSMRICQ
jgi:hypothetical protein